MRLTNDPYGLINKRITPQSEQALPEQVQNSAGGFSFKISDEERLRRFLILGSDKGTYYINAPELTKDNAELIIKMAETDHETLLRTIVDISTRGAAPKQNPTLFALAVACSYGDPEHRSKALAALPMVARTGTMLFIFARYIEQFRGWGRSLRRGVANWYTSKTSDRLAYQAVKYRQREGWSHRDLLRLSHPVTEDPGLKATFDWITHNTIGDDTPRLIDGFMKVQKAGMVQTYTNTILEHELTWEMLPDSALSHPMVWEALLDVGMPQTALIRQLPRLTKLGVVSDLGGRTDEIVRQITDQNRLNNARVHPINLLVAHKTYASGRSDRGKSMWIPVRRIVDALDEAFYKAFESFEPSGKRTLLALDVSGSMGCETTATGLNAREASVALAMVTQATEPNTHIIGFTGSGPGYYDYWNNHLTQGINNVSPLNISHKQQLRDAINTVAKLPFGSTDCALPMLYAQQKGLKVDTFVIYTDNETWRGAIHPHQALEQYRQASGIPAKLVVVGMTSTQFSIANPKDSGMLDVAGFDTNVPSLINEFSRGL